MNLSHLSIQKYKHILKISIMFNQVQFLPSFQNIFIFQKEKKINYEKKGPLKLNIDTFETEKYNTLFVKTQFEKNPSFTPYTSHQIKKSA